MLVWNTTLILYIDVITMNGQQDQKVASTTEIFTNIYEFQSVGNKSCRCQESAISVKSSGVQDIPSKTKDKLSHLVFPTSRKQA